jgi:hypothetical protein
MRPRGSGSTEVVLWPGVRAASVVMKISAGASPVGRISASMLGIWLVMAMANISLARRRAPLRPISPVGGIFLMLSGSGIISFISYLSLAILCTRQGLLKGEHLSFITCCLYFLYFGMLPIYSCCYSFTWLHYLSLLFISVIFVFTRGYSFCLLLPGMHTWVLLTSPRSVLLLLY